MDLLGLIEKIPFAYKLTGALALMTIIVIGSTLWIKAIEHDAQNTGVTVERARVQTQIIKNVEVGHAAAQVIATQSAVGAGRELYAQCLRSARNPEQCQRFLPR